MNSGHNIKTNLFSIVFTTSVGYLEIETKLSVKLFWVKVIEYKRRAKTVHICILE